MAVRVVDLDANSGAQPSGRQCPSCGTLSDFNAATCENCGLIFNDLSRDRDSITHGEGGPVDQLTSFSGGRRKASVFQEPQVDLKDLDAGTVNKALAGALRESLDSLPEMIRRAIRRSQGRVD